MAASTSNTNVFFFFFFYLVFFLVFTAGHASASPSALEPTNGDDVDVVLMVQDEQSTEAGPADVSEEEEEEEEELWVEPTMTVIDNDTFLRRLERVQTFRRPIRIKTRPVWYNGQAPAAVRSSSTSTSTTKGSSAPDGSKADIAATTPWTTETEEVNAAATDSTTDATPADDATSHSMDTTIELSQSQEEKWLMDTLEEVAQTVQDAERAEQQRQQPTAAGTEAPDVQQEKWNPQANSLSYAASHLVAVDDTVTDAPLPAPISSSATVWIYRPTMAPSKPQPAANSNAMSRWAVTGKPAAAGSVSTTARILKKPSPNGLVTAAKSGPDMGRVTTTAHHKVARSTLASQTMKSRTALPSTRQQTTEWWVTQPNFQFDTLSAEEADDVSGEGSQTTAIWTELGQQSAELAPPKSPPHFNVFYQDGQQAAADTAVPNRPAHFYQSTPRLPLSAHPLIVKAPLATRTSTHRPKTTGQPATTTSSRRPSTTKRAAPTTTTAKTTAKTTTTTTTTTTVKPKTSRPRMTSSTSTTLSTRKPPATIPIRQATSRPASVQFVRVPLPSLRPPFPVDSGVTDEPGNFQEFNRPTPAPSPEASEVSDVLEIDVGGTEIRPVFPLEFETDQQFEVGVGDVIDDTAGPDANSTTDGADASGSATTSSASGGGDSDSGLIDEQNVPINFVVVNIWNYVGGQLTLVGQQVVPAQVLAGINITNGATIQSSSLPDTILSQLTSLLASTTPLTSTTPSITTTTTTTTTTTPTPTLPPRPYGGVGNPTLVGVGPSVVKGPGYGQPSPTYGPPKAPLTSYGPPPPSQLYGPPPAPSIAAPVHYYAPATTTTTTTLAPLYGPAEQSYHLPLPTPLDLEAVQYPSTSYGPPPTTKAPSTSYGPPVIAAPSLSYRPPPKAPSTSYGPPPPPPPPPSPPKAPSTSYGVPSILIGQPIHASYGPPPPTIRPVDLEAYTEKYHQHHYHHHHASNMDDHPDHRTTTTTTTTPPPVTSHPAPLLPNHHQLSSASYSQFQLKPPPPRAPEINNHYIVQGLANANQINGDRHRNKNAAHSKAPGRRPTNKKKPGVKGVVSTTLRTPQGNLNFVDIHEGAQSGAFVKGGHPLGALLPDFILESLGHPMSFLPHEFSHRSGHVAPRFDDSPSQVVQKLHQSNFRSDVMASGRTANDGESITGRPGAQPSIQATKSNNKAKNPVSDDVTSQLTNKASKHSFDPRPPVTISRPSPSAMEIAFGEAVGKKLTPVARYPSAQPQSGHPLDSSHDVEDLEETHSTTSTASEAATKVKSDRRRFSLQSGMKFNLPAAAISAAALSLPVLVGRKRRHIQPRRGPHWQVKQEEHDPQAETAFVRHFTAENEREMRQKNIASYNCRQLSVNDGEAGAEGHGRSVATTLHHLLVCPGRQSRTLNMILLDGLIIR